MKPVRLLANFLILVIALLILNSCSDQPLPGHEPADLLDRKFLAVSMTENGQPRPLVPDSRIEVEFAAEDRGHIVRWSSCNFSGSLVDLSEQRVRLLEDELGTTQIGCPDELHAQDDWLMSFFRSAPHWVLDGDHLTLSADDAVMELEER